MGLIISRLIPLFCLNRRQLFTNRLHEGPSRLYHLVKHGWKDIVLLERSELTSGSALLRGRGEPRSETTPWRNHTVSVCQRETRVLDR